MANNQDIAGSEQLREDCVRFARYCNGLTPYKLNEPIDPLVMGAIHDFANNLLATHNTEKKQQVLKAIGEDEEVPEPKNWVDGMMDKPKSYKNNYHLIDRAKRNNALKAELRQAVEEIYKEMRDER